jgi:hypothetical protein
MSCSGDIGTSALGNEVGAHRCGDRLDDGHPLRTFPGAVEDLGDLILHHRDDGLQLELVPFFPELVPVEAEPVALFFEVGDTGAKKFDDEALRSPGFRACSRQGFL